MVRGSSFDKNGMKKGAWSEEEDNKLRAYIQRYGHWNWRLLPKFAGLKRCGKSCRQRWLNYLSPNIKRGNFTKEEDDLIISLHNKLGTKWSVMSAKLPGRSDNEIKNHWHTHLKKRAHEKNQTSSKNDTTEALESDQANPKEKTLENPESVPSPSLSASDHGSVSYGHLQQLFDYEPMGDFWTEPFLADIDHSINTDDYFLPPSDLFNDFIYPSSSSDTIMADELLWSTMDLFCEYDGQFI